MKLVKDSKGYLRVSLCKNGKQKNFKVHRLVAEAFLSNPNNKPQVNHKDEDKTNNKVENLEWCTNEYNARYSKCRKIIQYDLNGNFIKLWNSIVGAEENLNIPNSNIIKVCKGQRNNAGNYIWKYKD